MAQHISAELRQLSLKIIDLVESPDATTDVTEVQTLLMTKLVQLRAANRVTWQSSRLAKLKTSEAKAGIDRANLELQGLYYEQRHLKNEIKSCREAPTIFNEIALISEEEFLKTHPEGRDLAARDLMLARLGHEKDERLRLEEVRKELGAKKSALIAENKRRKGDLESLEAQLKAFISSAENIESIFQKY